MTWLDEIVLSHSELESPKSFWVWSALSAVSAVLKDNVWFNKQIYNLYPNIYVMLHADSGLKKGPPIAMANKLVNKVNNTKIIKGRSSIQAILKDMGTAHTEPGGKVISNHAIFICSSELTSSIVADPIATTILTDLYDRHYNEGEWKQLLKIDTFTLKSPTVTMLAGSNDAHTNSFFERKDVQGGYFARTFIIYEHERQGINSLMFPLENVPNYDELSKYLKTLSTLRGPLQMELSTRTYFDEWYKSFIKDRDLQEAKDITGTLNRFDDSVLKVAMLISLARAPELIISQSAVEEAISQCERLVGNARRTTMQKGERAFAEQKSMFITELLNRDGNMISRQMMNKKYYLLASHEEWDQIALQLEVAGIIRIETMSNHVVYVMPEKVVGEWQRHLGGKLK